VSVAQSFPSEKMSAFNVTDPGARPSQVVVFDFKTGAISAIIPIKSGNTTGLYRANHLC